MTEPGRFGPATYRGAGVDIAAGEAAVKRIKEIVASTARGEVLGAIGAFGSLFALDIARYSNPVLVSSADGVGTKALLASATRRYRSIGIDLVAMCVDDLVCMGAEPLFLLDYISTGVLDPEQIEDIVSGIAQGCRAASCSLVGGEMAEHPGSMKPGEFDLAGFAVGVVERDDLLGPARVVASDVVVGLASPGLRCNGYSLARHAILECAGMDLDGPAWSGATSSLADELLRPSLVYAPAVLEAIAAAGGPSRGGSSGSVGGVHAAAHITGGGIPGNLVRVIPESCDALVDRGAWEVPKIFDEIARLGPVEDAEMLEVFNLGIGMILVVDTRSVQDVLRAAAASGHDAMVIGEVVPGSGRVRFGGSESSEVDVHPER